MSKLYTTKEVMERVGISRTTLYNWLNRGKVRDVLRDRNDYRVFSEKDVKRLLDYKNLIREPVSVKQAKGRRR